YNNAPASSHHIKSLHEFFRVSHAFYKNASHNFATLYKFAKHLSVSYLDFYPLTGVKKPSSKPFKHCFYLKKHAFQTPLTGQSRAKSGAGYAYCLQDLALSASNQWLMCVALQQLKKQLFTI